VVKEIAIEAIAGDHDDARAVPYLLHIMESDADLHQSCIQALIRHGVNTAAKQVAPSARRGATSDISR